MKKDILIITNYFPPEKGAASNRIFAMANSYLEYDYKVTVVCPLPNYPQGSIFKDYKKKFFLKETIKGIDVRRLWLFASKSKSKFVRLCSMLSFGICLFFFLLFSKTPKKVIIQCSPLFVGFFATLASKIKRKTIILNVSDLWPLAGLEMGILKKGFYFNMLKKIEKYNYKSANLVLGQSKEILNHITSYFPNKSTFLYRNLPDFEPKKISPTRSSKNIKIVYAGLLGVAQGVAEICQKIKLPNNVIFDIYGDGPESDTIKTISDKNPQINFHGLIDREELHKILTKYDFTLIPLTNRIYGSVPSKIFEFSRLGIPILYFSEGEGAKLVEQYNLGYTIKDKDYKGLNELIRSLSKNKTMSFSKEKIQEKALESFDFDKQFKQLLEINAHY